MGSVAVSRTKRAFFFHIHKNTHPACFMISYFHDFLIPKNIYKKKKEIQKTFIQVAKSYSSPGEMQSILVFHPRHLPSSVLRVAFPF